MFGIFALIYIPFMLFRVVFMMLRGIGIILFVLARIALNNQQRKQRNTSGQVQHVRIKLRRNQYPTFGANGKTKIFI